jgi:hypothetical protein
METPSLANIEYFEWKQQIENARGEPAKLLEIEKQMAGDLIKKQDATLRFFEQLLLPLLDNYGIPHEDPKRWLLLAGFLAFESGKLTARPAHAPIKWNDLTGRELCIRVLDAKAQIAKETGCEINSVPDIKACQRIRQDHPEWYKTKKGRSLDPSTLQKNFREALLREALRQLKARKELLPT